MPGTGGQEGQLPLPWTLPDQPSLHPDCFGCLCWSHSETHLLYVAEKKRPKTESFFQTKALDISAGDDETARPKKPEQAVKVLVAMAYPCASLVTLYLPELGAGGGKHLLLGGQAGSHGGAGH